jgi:hypothetical protein
MAASEARVACRQFRQPALATGKPEGSAVPKPPDPRIKAARSNFRMVSVSL